MKDFSIEHLQQYRVYSSQLQVWFVGYGAGLALIVTTNTSLSKLLTEADILGEVLKLVALAILIQVAQLLLARWTQLALHRRERLREIHVDSLQQLRDAECEDKKLEEQARTDRLIYERNREEFFTKFAIFYSWRPLWFFALYDLLILFLLATASWKALVVFE